MQGLQQAHPLQEQITKYVERNVTILGESTNPLIIQVVHLQLQQVQNVNEGQVEKLEGIILLLNNYVGQIKDKSLDLIENIIDSVLQKVLQIPVPVSNTSEIEKL